MMKLALVLAVMCVCLSMECAGVDLQPKRTPCQSVTLKIRDSLGDVMFEANTVLIGFIGNLINLLTRAAMIDHRFQFCMSYNKMDGFELMGINGQKSGDGKNWEVLRCPKNGTDEIPFDTSMDTLIPENMDTIIFNRKEVLQCPTGWHHFEGSCYYFHPDVAKISRESAKQKCMEREVMSSLVAIETSEEYTFLKDFIIDNVANPTQYNWMTSGMKVDSQWIWTPTGDVVDFDDAVRWAENQPVASDAMNLRDCMKLKGMEDFKIYNGVCSRPANHRYICEMDLN